MGNKLQRTLGIMLIVFKTKWQTNSTHTRQHEMSRQPQSLRMKEVGNMPEQENLGSSDKMMECTQGQTGLSNSTPTTTHSEGGI